MGLMSVSDILQLNTYLEVTDAYSIFASFFDSSEPDKDIFKEKNLDSEIGLCCCLFTNPVNNVQYVVQRDVNMRTEKVLQKLVEDSVFASGEEEQLNPEIVGKLINSMDTEYDRQCIKQVLCTLFPGSKLYSYGMNPGVARRSLLKQLFVIEECENAQLAAEDILKLRLKQEVENLQKQIEEIDDCVKKFEDSWSVSKLLEVKENRDELSDKLKQKTDLLEESNDSSTKKFRGSVKRIADGLISDNRIKRRKLGGGAPRKLESDDEDYIQDIFEGESADPHGRRHDEVCYVHKKFTKSRLKRIINERRIGLGKQKIKSSSTVYHRMKPVNKRHIQAKAHIGKGLFCIRKPPKSEENDKVHTKYQRAHVKRTIEHITYNDPQYSLIVSRDDKAYVKAEGSDALDTKTFQLSDLDKAGKLPKYDFANPLLHITPGSHRFIDYKIENVDGQQIIQTVKDESLCGMRPKYYVGSNGSVWASEDRRLHYQKPHLHEIPGNTNYTISFRSGCTCIKDKLIHFRLSTMQEDLRNITKEPNCPYRQYEWKRVNTLKCQLKKGLDIFEKNLRNMTEQEKAVLPELTTAVQSVLDTADSVLTHGNIDDISLYSTTITEQCDTVVNRINALSLPSSRPRVFEQTDAGPGVGISNKQVQFRSAEKVMIEYLDFYVRIHRASGDCQNPVERTQAAVGKALANGDRIHWEYRKMFDGLTEEEKERMSLEDFVDHEDRRMRYNVFMTCKDLAGRIQDSPGPRGSLDPMTGFVSEPTEELFSAIQNS